MKVTHTLMEMVFFMLRISLLLQAVHLAGDTEGFAHHQGLLWWIRFEQLQNCAKISDD